MATLTIRVDDDLRDDLERAARDRGTNVSELIRAGISRVLGRDGDSPRGRTPRTLTAVERRTLSYQHLILADLAEDEELVRHHRRRAEALEAGYTAEYEDEFVDIEPELTPADCELVWDILDMFRVLRTSVERVKAEDIADIPDYVFQLRGFDGNDGYESQLCRYARHMMANGRWDDLDDFLKRENGNSHARMLPTYQRMLAVFKPIWRRRLHGRGEGYDLSVEELKEVAEVWPHLDRRG